MNRAWGVLAGTTATSYQPTEAFESPEGAGLTWCFCHISTTPWFVFVLGSLLGLRENNNRTAHDHRVNFKTTQVGIFYSTSAQGTTDYC